jgi:hypothetical protein
MLIVLQMQITAQCYLQNHYIYFAFGRRNMSIIWSLVTCYFLECVHRTFQFTLPFFYLLSMSVTGLRAHKTKTTPMQTKIGVYCHSYFHVHHGFHSTKWYVAKLDAICDVSCECEALATLGHIYLGLFFLDPHDIRGRSLGAIWNFIKRAGLSRLGPS